MSRKPFLFYFIIDIRLECDRVSLVTHCISKEASRLAKNVFVLTTDSRAKIVRSKAVVLLLLIRCLLLLP